MSLVDIYHESILKLFRMVLTKIRLNSEYAWVLQFFLIAAKPRNYISISIKLTEL